MPRVVAAVLLLLISAAAQSAPPADGAQQFASIGDRKLQSGQVIRDCRIGYRTFGYLNDNKSNVVLFPTWFGGRTQDLVGLIGPGKLVDSSKYFVVTVDALGDGVSSSPSNSQAQPRMKFPQFAIRDMVESEHRLLIIVDAHDHMITPGPALDFAKLKGAQTLVLGNDCGHLGPGCDMAKVSTAVAEFLGR